MDQALPQQRKTHDRSGRFSVDEIEPRIAPQPICWTSVLAAVRIPIVAVNLLQRVLIAAAIVGGVAAIYQANEACALRRENEALQRMQASLLEQIQRLTLERYDYHELSNRLAEAPTSSVGNEELSELLRLRGQVALLRNQLRERTASEVREKSANTARLSSTSFCVRVPAGETLISGGWVSEPGRRLFLISTPDSDGSSINIESSLVEVGESVWKQLGFEGLRASPGQEIRNMVATADVPKLFEGFKDDFNIARVPRISTSDGRAAMVSVELPSRAAGSESGNGGRFLTIGVAPRRRQNTAGVSAFDLVMNIHVLRPGPTSAADLSIPQKEP